MEEVLVFSFIYGLVKDMYSEVGRPSIDPVILIKLTFIQYTFGIRSMRWTTLRGLKELSMQAMLTFAALNLKRIANWIWRGPEVA